MGTSKRPSGGHEAGSQDDLVAFRQRRAEARHRARTDALGKHAKRQQEARERRANGDRNPWQSKGLVPDTMHRWDIEQRDERLNHYELHSHYQQDEDGAPALREAFVVYLSRVFNTAQGQQPADEQLVDARSGEPWLTPRQIALLLQVSSSTIHRAIHNHYLACERPGGPHGHYRVGIDAFAAYLQQAGYSREAVARIGERLQRLLGRKAAAPSN